MSPSIWDRSMEQSCRGEHSRGSLLRTAGRSTAASTAAAAALSRETRVSQ